MERCTPRSPRHGSCLGAKRGCARDLGAANRRIKLGLALDSSLTVPMRPVAARDRGSRQGLRDPGQGGASGRAVGLVPVLTQCCLVCSVPGMAAPSDACPCVLVWCARSFTCRSVELTPCTQCGDSSSVCVAIVRRGMAKVRSGYGSVYCEGWDAEMQRMSLHGVDYCDGQGGTGTRPRDRMRCTKWASKARPRSCIFSLRA